MHAGQVEREGRFVVGDDSEDARGDGVALVPLVLRVQGVGEPKEDVGVVGQGILCFQTTAGDGDLAKMLVLDRAQEEETVRSEVD